MQGDRPMNAVGGPTKRAAFMADMGADHSHVPADAESFRCVRRCMLCAKSEQGSKLSG